MQRVNEFWTLVIGVALAVAIRLTGVITNLPIAIAAVTLIVGYLALEQRFPDGRAKTVVRGSYAAMVVLVIASLVWTWGWGYFPRTQEGAELAQRASDIAGQERIRPPALVATDSVQKACNEVDNQLGVEIYKRTEQYRELVSGKSAKPFSGDNTLNQQLKNTLDELAKLVNENREHRKQCSKIVLGWNPPAGGSGAKAGNSAGGSSEFLQFFRNIWGGYRSKMWLDQLAWALLAFGAVALVAKVLMGRRATSAPAPSGGGTSSKYEYAVMILWVGAAAFLAALTAFYGMGNWLIPAIVLGTAVLWTIIQGKNPSWRNGLVMACIVWVMVGLGVGFVWAVGWDAHSQEQYFRAGTRSAVSWLIGGRPLPQ